eukprot:XP_001708539.1 VSP [Giardia lamblia ATCC 50803]
MGVDNCLKCTAPANNKGVAKCTACTEGHFLHTDGTCQACGTGCSECTSNTVCTHCMPGRYLKTGGSCVDGSGSTCGEKKYPDPTTRECKACPEACRVCAYDDVLQQPVCSECDSGQAKNLLKKKVDGTAECVDENGCPTGETHFVDKTAGTKCLPCGDESKGVANCETCSAAQQCTKCLPGFFETNPTTCTDCTGHCAECGTAGQIDTCTKCLPGFFLKSSGGKECVLCGDSQKGGIDGCDVCEGTEDALKCTKCKVNYRPSGEPSTGVTCTKACEDDTACGGTAGACDAIVIDNDGKELHYCSFCGDSSQAPINGKCVASGSYDSNHCAKGVCTQCTNNYFLYMGGCYSVSAQPGNLMCKTAGNNGICTEAANNKYFIVPEAKPTQQSVLACGNPLGTLVGTGGTAKAYVGVDGCSQCKAPTQIDTLGMTPAICTACDSDRKPNRDGSGCVLCSVGDCKSCVVDGVCGECNSGFSLEGGKCVSSGTNRSGLSTGAIAGISVAVVAVVGGLVGFLCRGKA